MPIYLVPLTDQCGVCGFLRAGTRASGRLLKMLWQKMHWILLLF